MESLARESDPFELLLEVLGDPASVEWSAGLRGEDEVPLAADPRRAGPQALLKLPRPMGAEDGDEFVRERHGAA